MSGLNDPPAGIPAFADAVAARVREWVLRSVPVLDLTLESDGMTETGVLTIEVMLAHGERYEASFREEMGLGEVRAERAENES